MEIDLSSGPADADVTAFAVLDPVGAIPDLDPRLAGLARAGEISGATGRTCVLHQDSGRKIVVAGAGDREQLDTDAIRDAAAAVARLGVDGTLAWLLDDALPLSAADQARAAVDGVVLGSYDQGRWKTADQPRPQPR